VRRSLKLEVRRDRRARRRVEESFRKGANRKENLKTKSIYNDRTLSHKRQTEDRKETKTGILLFIVGKIESRASNIS